MKPLNPKQLEINARWTAEPPQKGWRHFRIGTIRKRESGGHEFEMISVCDRSVRFWVTRDILKQELWVAGWID